MDFSVKCQNLLIPLVIKDLVLYIEELEYRHRVQLMSAI